jgi:hypothetical protein
MAVMAICVVTPLPGARNLGINAQVIKWRRYRQ